MNQLHIQDSPPKSRQQLFLEQMHIRNQISKNKETSNRGSIRAALEDAPLIHHASQPMYAQQSQPMQVKQTPLDKLREPLQQQQEQEQQRVNVIGRSKKRNVCIGMISTDIVVEKHPLILIRDHNFEIVTMESEGRLNNQNYSFRVISRSVPKKFYGWIPFKDTKVLGPLVDHRLIWWDTVIPRGKANHTRTPIYVILYCQPDMVATLSKYLMSQHVFLKTPPFYNPECRLHNPHAYLIPSDVARIPKKKRQLSSVNSFGVIEILSDDEENELHEDDPSYVEGMTVRLMEHQIQGVGWMMDRENNKSSQGGILADMGLGKTIQTIALILSTLKSEDQATSEHRMTLIVTPLSLLQQWVDEIKNKTETNTLRVLKHHGANRIKDPCLFHNYDVVVTTYQVLASDMGEKKTSIRIKKNKDGLDDFVIDEEEEDKIKSACDLPLAWQKLKKGYGALFQVNWYRVVLDEAQQIKNRTTKASLSCAELSSVKRWCLTGTPIQNNVDELYSLLRFLKIQPLADYNSFRHNITNPIHAGDSQRAMERLKAVLMAVMLRRTKNVLKEEDGLVDVRVEDELKAAANLQLPNKQRQDLMLRLTEPEKALYDNIIARGKSNLQALFDKQHGAYASVLYLLLRLRQACDHPQLILKEFDKDSLDIESDVNLNDDVINKCQLCGRPDVLRVCTECGETSSVSLQSETFKSSTKVNKLIEILKETRENNPGEKTIVFSQFTSMLDLIENPLREHGFHFCRYDGSMSGNTRERNLDSLRYDPTCTVMLISLKCGSLGLNLTAANRVILMDIWWNPALEEQAIDRVHRIGQRLPVYVTRLIVDDTVELKIMALQNEKAQLTKGAIGDGLVKSTKLTANEIRKLFDL
ncbi:SNF2 family N-terminal domain-containing protein [Gilbertella persicaria]|uniref:SNF2 family N-terminal domain-containing protein n=1 Tax=Gilbertella persicaria TaxID=101096 RepID=UPI00221E6B8A|nr:SNF2 family N-terminal domain-containing protein [Gilbertella persicaria]KAI8057558.1 SNF2 family N-terminal domain-containing protein [Gilbertella persicaria]